MIEEISLGPDDVALRVDATLDWREPRHLLKLRFPTSLTDPQATYEIPFGTLPRPVDGAEEPAQSWVDLTGVVEGAVGGAVGGAGRGAQLGDTLVLLNQYVEGLNPSLPDLEANLRALAPTADIYNQAAPDLILALDNLVFPA